MSTSPFPPSAALEKPVCVFCGSSPGATPLYTIAATSIGRALAEANIPLVYGGGRKGIMGVVSQSALTAGGYVHGVLPRALVDVSEDNSNPHSKEGQGKDVLNGVPEVKGTMSVEIVESMHERKLKMAQLSTGGFVVLPGGYGTFEEVLEMITWNQLGIHRLPILIMNIGNFFTPLLTLFQNAVEAGFIQPVNLSLMKVVDLPGGKSSNLDETRAGEWGAVAIKALEDWSFDNTAAAVSSGSYPALFTTLRFTSPSETSTIPVLRSHIPLLDRHIRRLRRAHAYFSDRDGTAVWGDWVGEEKLWSLLHTRLEEVEQEKTGDWRVRVVYPPGGAIRVEVVPAPAGCGPFTCLPQPEGTTTRRPLVLDPIDTEPEDDPHLRMYKTVERSMYDCASARGSKLHPELSHPEVLLHTSTHLLESATSNIAVYRPEPGQPDWLTPILDTKEAPFLPGVMREYLLESKIIREGEVRLEDWAEVKRDGGRLIGFNGLRGVWEARLL
ncbi:cytokinin riboside 5'-monophosphate phosphoribohydrolase, partial [Tremellales sp. Uapishka_1]